MPDLYYVGLTCHCNKLHENSLCNEINNAYIQSGVHLYYMQEAFAVHHSWLSLPQL